MSSSIPRGLRSEPTIDARFQKLARAARDPKAAARLPRVDLNNKTWESDWSFLLWVGPEAAGDYLAATSEGVDNPYDTFRRLLSDERVYTSPSALGYLLEYFQQAADNPFEFSAIIAGSAKVLIRSLANPQKATPEHWESLDLLFERFDLGRRHDLFSSNKNMAHLVVDVFLDVEVEQLLLPGSADEFEAHQAELANRLFAMINQAGGNLDHQARMSVGKDTTAVLTPLLVAARAYDQGKGGEVLMGALLGAGARWQDGPPMVGYSSREFIENHPKVKSSRLLEVAHHRPSGPGNRKI